MDGPDPEDARARDGLLDVLMLLEQATMPDVWAVVATCGYGSQSVHGTYQDPMDALCAADLLHAELRALDDGVLTWKITVVPFFPTDHARGATGVPAAMDCAPARRAGLLRRRRASRP